ncbi:hypothetical protein [Streptomyces sp. NPDC018347]|uniref:hypothetical protein n=1 Tax=Streptomyces sp. NPDC018347 TaxID=3157193 RepID=UPI0033FB0B25
MDDAEPLWEVAASMPPEAHAVPLATDGPLLLPDPERLLRDFLDAVADVLPRSPAAPPTTGGPAFAAPEPLRPRSAEGGHGRARERAAREGAGGP